LVSKTNPYMVEKNVTFPDFETGKANELDVIATIVSDSDPANKPPTFIVRNTLILECKNNEQPVAFFKGGHEVKYYLGHHGAEFHTSQENIPQKYKSRMYAGREKYFSAPTCTQYCSFAQKNSGNKAWIAKHEDDQHSNFRKLCRAVEFYCLREKQVNFLNVEVKYLSRFIWPVIVLQNDMFIVNETDGAIDLSPTDHIVYIHEDVIGKSHGPYCVDVIRESALPKFLKNFELADKEIVQGAIDSMRRRMGYKAKFIVREPNISKRR